MTVEEAIGAAISESLAQSLPGIVEQLVEAGGPRAYTPAEVAERLGLSDDTVYRLIARGVLPTVPNLPKTRIAARALEAFLASTRANPDEVAS